MAELGKIPPKGDDRIVRIVDLLLERALDARAGDIHLQPDEFGLVIRWRIDGVLVPIGSFPSDISSNVINRLKVMADLLTYRTDTPQEGRLRKRIRGMEVRVSTFPTIHGERGAIRLFLETGRIGQLDELGFSPGFVRELRPVFQPRGGLTLITGPAGSGKTTTLYAALAGLATRAESEPPLNIVSVEDPVEQRVAGVSSSEIRTAAGFDFPTAIRSLLRQDPDVMMIGEIRDRATVEAAFHAALAGHLVLSTFHAGSAPQALCRLGEAGMEPYLLRSALHAVVGQRLFRRLHDCARPVSGDSARGRADHPLPEASSGVVHGDPPPRGALDSLFGLEVDPASVRVPTGCPGCGGIGYLGRVPVGELLLPSRPELADPILGRADVSRLTAAALEAGFVPLAQSALELVRAGVTAPIEYRRVLGE
jgi:type II secretory ATPase GspE/PulE/Tfp pilus assembly ATPase PilB-like protein